MNGNEDFQQRFDALGVTMRAALVFRYREGLPLSHVAQLVDRPARKLGPEIDRAVAGLRDAGVREAKPDSQGDPAAALARELEELRGDPALSSFSLVRAVRAEQLNRRGLFRGLFRGRMTRRFAEEPAPPVTASPSASC